MELTPIEGETDLVVYYLIKRFVNYRIRRKEQLKPAAEEHKIPDTNEHDS